MALCVYEKDQASLAGFSTKHVVIDSREPEIKNQLKAGMLGCGNVSSAAEDTLAGFLVPVNGFEPLPIHLQGDRSTIGAKPAYLAGQRGLEPR